MPPEQAGNLTNYKVVVKTGDYKWAGTDSIVNLTIVGEKSVTKMIVFERLPPSIKKISIDRIVFFANFSSSKAPSC